MSSAAFNEQNDAERVRSRNADLIARIIGLETLGQAGKALESVNGLMQAPDASTIYVMANIMGGAVEGGALHQKAAKNLLSLSFLLEDNHYRAAEACWIAAKNLPPSDSAGQAAIDRVLDIADQKLGNPEQAVAFIFVAAGRALPQSDLDLKGRDLWLKHLNALEDDRKRDEIKYAVRHVPPGSALQESAVALWVSAVRQELDRHQVDNAFADIHDIVTDPDTAGVLEQEAARLWREAIEKFPNVNNAMLKASRTSQDIYEGNSHGRFAAIKRIVAETLLDLSGQTTNPGIVYQLVAKAADYDGDDLEVRRRIAGCLSDIARNSLQWEHRQGAGYKLSQHLNFIKTHGGNGGDRPPPPAP